MATIHLGRMEGAGGFSRPVAIKQLHAHLAGDPDRVAMLLDEGRLAARIAHPNVVATIDVVKTEDALFLVMEYVDGVALSSLLATARTRNEPVPLAVVTAVVVGMLHGLHAAHEAPGLELVHRDVSPQNVLLAIDGVPRVADFGIAKAAGRSSVTREGQIKGKIPYMAPEQLRAGEIDRRADIWAAGIVLWEMIAGQRAYRGDDAQVMGEILYGKLGPPLRDGATTALDGVVARALERFPERRWSTAREMADALEQAVRPATASEVGAWVQALGADDLARNATLRGEVDAKRPERVIETGTRAREETATPTRVRRLRRVTTILAIAVAVLTVLVIVSFVRGAAREKPTRDAIGAASAEPPPPPASTAAPVESAIASVSPDPPLPQPSMRKRPSPAPRPPSAPPKPSGTRDARCYRLDDQGIWHIKPECL